MIKAYEGQHPYAFISYSHKDAEVVMPIIEILHKRGILIWYDAGVEAGSEWPEYIASHLRGCGCVLTFISKHFIDSPNCRRELNFAQDLRKDILNVFIDDVQLTDGMRMQLGLNQALIKKNYHRDEDFYSAISEARILSPCKNGKQPGDPVSDPIPTPAPPSAPVPTTKPKPTPPVDIDELFVSAGFIVPSHTKKRKRITWITSLIELFYLYLGIATIPILSSTEGVWGLMWKVGLIHLIFPVVNLIIMKLFGKDFTKYECQVASKGASAVFLLVAIAVIIASPFFMSYAINGFRKFLISLGSHVLPFFIGCYIYDTAYSSKFE